MPGYHVHSVHNIAVIYFTCGMWACLAAAEAWGEAHTWRTPLPRGFCLHAVQDMLGEGHGLEGVRQWVPRWLPPVGTPEAPRSLSMGTTCPEGPLSLSHG